MHQRLLVFYRQETGQNLQIQTLFHYSFQQLIAFLVTPTLKQKKR